MRKHYAFAFIVIIFKIEITFAQKYLRDLYYEVECTVLCSIFCAYRLG